MKLTTKKFVVTVVIDVAELGTVAKQRDLRRALEDKASDFVGVYASSADDIAHDGKVVEAPDPNPEDMDGYEEWERVHVDPLLY